MLKTLYDIGQQTDTMHVENYSEAKPKIGDFVGFARGIWENDNKNVKWLSRIHKNEVLGKL